MRIRLFDIGAETIQLLCPKGPGFRGSVAPNSSADSLFAVRFSGISSEIPNPARAGSFHETYFAILATTNATRQGLHT